MAVAELSEPAVMEKTHSSSHSAWVRPLRMKEPWARGGLNFCVCQEGKGGKRTSMSFWSGAVGTKRRSTISLDSLSEGPNVTMEIRTDGRSATDSPHQLAESRLVLLGRPEEAEKRVAVEDVAQQGNVQREPHDAPDALELGNEAKHV